MLPIDVLNCRIITIWDTKIFVFCRSKRV